MDWLFSFYIGATIFGAGVTIVDLLGLIGHHGDNADQSASHDDAGAHDHDGSHDDADAYDHDGSHDDADAYDHDGIHDDADAHDHDGSHDDAGAHDHALHDTGTHDTHHDLAVHSSAQHSVAGHDSFLKRFNPVVSLLTLMRSIVYFCIGFGPVGWFGIATGMNPFISLLWSVPFGLVTVFGTRALRRFMRKELDSQVSESQLLMEEAEVMVSINKGQMGKIRIHLGGSYVERYAKARNNEKSFHAGTIVYVVELDDDCLLVDEDKDY